ANIGRRHRGEKHGRLNLQCIAHDIMTADSLTRGDPYARSRPWPAFKQALEFEPQQSFGYRKETHAQLGRNFTARNDLAHGKFAAQNTVLHELVSFGSKTCGRRRLSHHKLLSFHDGCAL